MVVNLAIRVMEDTHRTYGSSYVDSEGLRVIQRRDPTQAWAD